MKKINSDIISLNEIAAGVWQAKYRGNYGTYNIKIKMNGNKLDSFSCSCPSDYYPCKHIAIIEDAIDTRISEKKSEPKENGISVADLLKKVPHQDLINFIVRYSEYNSEFTNKLQLEFISKAPDGKENNYSLILRKALKKISYDYDDLYEYQDDSIELDILDEWLKKAKEKISQKQFDDAIAICKACIEEYAEWLENIEEDIAEYMDISYHEKPFELLLEITTIQKIYSNDLFEYCIIEMNKSKYENSGFNDYFNNLLSGLTQTTENSEKFIVLQDNLLQKITDKSSYDARKILERKITFYNKNNQQEIAKQIILENIQIEEFRKKVVEEMIAEKKFTEAKKLITDFLSTQKENFYSHSEWNKLTLRIAQKEHDLPLIRKISFDFIASYFQSDNYHIYKSSFKPEEWETEVRNLIYHYENKNKNYYSDNVAKVLKEEKNSAGLLKYIEKFLTLDRIESYYSNFSKVYPKETLLLFQKATNDYAEKNTGRNFYEHIASIMKKISMIEGGKEVAEKLINNYKILYKNRRAMIEILNKIKL